MLGGAALLLSGCATIRAKRTQTAGPSTTTAPGPSRKELIDRGAKTPSPSLAGGAHVAEFVNWASTVPVSMREQVRAQLHDAQKDDAVAKALIREFNASEHVDFSRALVTLSLLGELRNPVGTAFLTEYVWRPLPTGGVAIGESGQSIEAESMERLQVQAVNGIAYTKDTKALSEVLKVVAKHPSKAVRAEAASSYLWNAGNSGKARETLGRYLRTDERAILDRPVRGVNMSGAEFNRQLDEFLKRHPELRPPAPSKAESNHSHPAGHDTAPHDNPQPPPF